MIHWVRFDVLVAGLPAEIAIADEGLMARGNLEPAVESS